MGEGGGGEEKALSLFRWYSGYCFSKTTEGTSTVQPKQNRFHFLILLYYYIFEWQFPPGSPSLD